MNQTVKNWDTSYYACHFYWHQALYHLEKGDFEATGEIFENEILTRSMDKKSPLHSRDISSLVYRVEFEDPIKSNNMIGGHRDFLGDISEPFIHDHSCTFIDAQFVMALCVARRYSKAEELIEISRTAVTTSGEPVIIDLLEAVLDYSREKYAECVEKLFPIRHDLKTIGGSGPQRDVFHQMLIVSAMRSPKFGHRQIAKLLLNERAVVRDNSQLTQRLANQLNN